MNELVITPLGTVSPYCKGDKNCPGYLFEYHDRKILVDCGNGVTRLLNFPEDLKNLSVIITHYHKDHYGDIGSIQYASHVYRKLLSMYGIGVNIYLPDNSINYSKRAIMDTEEAYCRYAFIRDGDSYDFDDLNVSFKDNKSHKIIKKNVIQNNNEEDKEEEINKLNVRPKFVVNSKFKKYPPEVRIETKKKMAIITQGPINVSEYRKNRIFKDENLEEHQIYYFKHPNSKSTVNNPYLIVK